MQNLEQPITKPPYVVGNQVLILEHFRPKGASCLGYLGTILALVDPYYPKQIQCSTCHNKKVILQIPQV